MASITLEGISKRFATGGLAVRDLHLTIADGELLVLLGPSGSGKSTVLRLIAGLEQPTAGTIAIGDRDVTAVPPQARDLAMVFQSYALYPHKTVRENLAFGLRVRRLPPSVAAARVAQAAQSLGIEGLLDRKPGQLSGGQRQRVALGRAIVREPHAFLLDEPLSNLDPQLRVTTRAELALLQRRLRTTMVYVTHDQEEAMTLGTRIAVMRDGALEQVDEPMTLFLRPANTFVAGFIGSPAMNLLPGRVRRTGDRRVVESQSLGTSGIAARIAAQDRGVVVGIRPHDIDLTDRAAGTARGTVRVVEPLGTATLVHVEPEGDPTLVRVLVPPDATVRVDDVVGVRPREDRVHLFDADTGLRIEEARR